MSIGELESGFTTMQDAARRARLEAALERYLAVLLVDAFCALTGLSLLALILTAALFIYAFIFLTRLVLHRSRLIWRLRDRLIVTYLFMGAVPILLILALAYSGAYIVVGQVAAYLVGSELSRRALMLENPARVLAQSTPGERADILKEMAPLLRGRAPDFRVLVTGFAEGGQLVAASDRDAVSKVPPGDTKRAVIEPGNGGGDSADHRYTDDDGDELHDGQQSGEQE